MTDRIGRQIDYLIDHYIVVCIVLALIILSQIGVGDMRTVSMLCLLLCVVGIAQPAAQVDVWILLPLIGYDLLCMASTAAAYGNIIDGYGIFHGVFPLLYLLMGCLDKKDQRILRQLCILWTGIVSAAGIGQFLYRALWQGSARRAGGLLGNPNAMGIFMAVGWCALQGFLTEQEEHGQRGQRFFSYIEPILLMALTLTLSMGSFIAMAAGICVLIDEKKRKWKDGTALTLLYACRLLAKAVLGMGTGMLLYLAAARSGLPLSSLLVLVYGGMLVLCWPRFMHFLEAYPKMAAGLSALGIFVAAAAVLVRPSALATFTERLEMMQNGLRYLTRSPLLGVGPYKWRYLNLADSDKYFNTWHIHNVLLHVGVEFGWIAMAMLLLVGGRAFQKKTEPSQKAGLAAFCLHNMIDTSFFYLGITSLTLLTAGEPACGGKQVRGPALKVLFGGAALLFAYSLYQGIRMA